MSQRTKVVRRGGPWQTSNGAAPKPARRRRLAGEPGKLPWRPGKLIYPALFILCLLLLAILKHVLNL